jgi:hypothetical protein
MLSEANPSQSTEGRDLRDAQVDFPSVCLAILRLIASLGSITDTLTLTGECAYSNDLKLG